MNLVFVFIFNEDYGLENFLIGECHYNKTISKKVQNEFKMFKLSSKTFIANRSSIELLIFQ